MKSFFKRSAISMIVLGMAGAAYAAPAKQQMSNAGMWSPHMTGWFIGVEGLDLRPDNGDLDYVTFNPTGSGPGVFSTNAISTSYNWDWRIYGGVKFTDNDDITLSWLRMRTSESDSVSPNTSVNTTPRWLYSNDWDSVSGHVNFDLDDAYGVWGHTVHFNNPWSVRFAAGVEYARLESDLRVLAQDINGDFSGAVVGYTSKNDTKGFGPRGEFDMTYHLPSNFALFANTNAALLVAQRDIALNAQVGDSDFEDDFDSSYFSKRHVIVPKLGMRLGLSYTMLFGQAGGEGMGGSSLTLAAGWQVESYIHAIERVETSNESQNGSSSEFQTTKTSNFGDHGLFLGLQFNSDWM